MIGLKIIRLHSNLKQFIMNAQVQVQVGRVKASKTNNRVTLVIPEGMHGRGLARFLKNHKEALEALPESDNEGDTSAPQ